MNDTAKVTTRHGVFKPGEMATSVLLPGFAVDVAAAFKAGEGASNVATSEPPA
jgi:hypothetical protein